VTSRRLDVALVVAEKTLTVAVMAETVVETETETTGTAIKVLDPMDDSCRSEAETRSTNFSWTPSLYTVFGKLF
jgi:hypothetical protein